MTASTSPEASAPMHATDSASIRPVDRWAATWLCSLSGLAILFWGVWIGFSDFSEPTQLALVGYEAPWRKINGRWIASIGRDRTQNDIVLHDRKASSEHLILERKGSKGRWWAHLLNRTPDRRITLRRGSAQEPPEEINRKRLRDGDSILLPWPADKLRILARQRQDWCSPTKVLQTLQLSDIKAFTPNRFTLFLVREHRLPLHINHWQPLLTGQLHGAERSRWLAHYQRYELPQETGFQWLEYRQQQWLLFSRKTKTWQPLQQAISWGSPKRTISLQRRAQLLRAPRYTLQHAQSACPFPLTPATFPGGLQIGKLGRLFFQQKRLFIQHFGQSTQPLQIVPQKGRARLLGAGRVHDGDHLSLGQIRYRVILREHSVRLIADASPTSRYLIPFFSQYPSETLPARKLLAPQRPLLVSGGEGEDPRAERWNLRTSLLASTTTSTQGAPQRPMFRLERGKDGFLLTPLEETTIHRVDAQGEPHQQAINKPTTLQPSDALYLARGMYLRLFRPSYQGLSARIAILWVFFGLGIVLLLFWLLHTGHLRWSPVPSDQLLQLLPAQDPRRRAWLRERPRPSILQSLRLRLLTLPILLLLPLALFLNGLGLYVLASLSLASMGLNHSDFLYRQVLWSLVGLLIFLLALLISPQKIWEKRKASRPKAPTPLVPEKPNENNRPWMLLLFLVFSLAIGIAVQQLWLILPMLLLYGYAHILRRAWQQSQPHTQPRYAIYAFFATLALLGTVPLLGVIAPPLVHNRFFLKVPGIGTIKLSEAAILTAIMFFAFSLAPEIFALRLIRARRRLSTTPERSLPPEVSISQQRLERLGGALRVGALYLLLLGAIAVLYTIQGDLGPGLILTLCFSLFLLFAFLAPGVDRLTTLGNFLRIAVVFAGIGLFVILPDLIAWFSPELATQQPELRKVQERLALWRQPWRYLVGEQILQNIWALASYKGTFQWFNNLHSDFVFTAVVRVLSPLWGIFVIFAMCTFPLAALASARLRWLPILPQDDDATLRLKQQTTAQALILLFGGIYLFAQNFIHVGSVLRLTPMTGVTLPWISSGGTSVVICYLVVALMYRQLRSPV
ncbi:MAG: FtsW/RodA/SpoVE family cell cycle protein [Myxococcales bacterium]|nr:FtsW/RodA/SpoVE family cell cycle protein [Myxococcales bacterium]